MFGSKQGNRWCGGKRFVYALGWCPMIAQAEHCLLRLQAFKSPEPCDGGLAYTSTMDKTTFGKTGFRVTALGYGAAPAAFLKADQDKVVAVLNHLLDAGVNLIDTAAMYPGSEEFLGNQFAHRRKDYVLVSKCGQKAADTTGDAWSRELILSSVERALRLLKTDVLDVMLLHSCELDVLKKGEAVAALVEAKNAGKIRFAGYSGDNEAAAYAAGLEDVAVIETSINLADQRNIDVVLPVCQENNVAVLAKRPIANAAWKDLATQPGMYKTYAKAYTERLVKMGLNPADIAPLDWAELALRFTLTQPGVHTAIIGTTNLANAGLNIGYAEKGHLSIDEVNKIRQCFQKADPAGEWLGER